MNLTNSFKCNWAHFELTSNCNLACVYCAVSQPWYQGINMAAEQAASVSQWLLQHKVQNININGHGETTILPLWDQIIKPLLHSEARCHLITNAAKIFSEDELDALCRLNSITISCDTFDPALYASLRRKSALKNVLRAVVAIRRTAEAKRLKSPTLILSCVLGAENSESLEEFILLAHSMQFHGIQLCSLTEYPLPSGAGFKLNPLSTLSHPEIKQLHQILELYTSSQSPLKSNFLSIHPGIFTEIQVALS
jgi:MoaA/NifB/PqqE/SkfB family radical SAM enzyme